MKSVVLIFPSSDIDGLSAQAIIDAILSGERDPKKLAASWMGLCPDNRISGGKVLKAKTRKVASRLAGAFRLGVFGLQRSQSQMGGYLRRMKGTLGKAEGTTAALGLTLQPAAA